MSNENNSVPSVTLRSGSTVTGSANVSGSVTGRTNVPSVIKIPGEDGITYTPYVDEFGNLSWTNDGDLPNPPTVNIMGPKGEVDTTGLVRFVNGIAPDENGNVDIETFVNLLIDAKLAEFEGGTSLPKHKLIDLEVEQSTASVV